MFDHTCLAEAQKLADSVLHQATPNPAVGCVLVRDVEIIGLGATQSPGGDHAEVEARAAGLRAENLIDEVLCFRAPISMGDNGRAVWNAIDVERISEVAAPWRLSLATFCDEVRDLWQ